MGNYYLTYPEITVQDEVVSALCDPKNFLEGSNPIFKDTAENIQRGFSFQDGNYLSARWPGDAYRFSHEFYKMLGKN